MIQAPSTITDLIDRLEKGDDPTPEEMKRTLRLQALYIAKTGEDYLRESLENQELADSQLKQAIGA